ncbi:MAG: lactate racemase domain-containing protein [Clostridia bacterium]|jgi:nickel-dependent lactate racemase|nr:lactate racemase domain-containing protein [Clostridia bacterium]
MKSIVKRSITNPISDIEAIKFIDDAYAVFSKNRIIKKILIIPPDFTRFYSMSGKITSMLYKRLKDICTIDILPALGTHMPMTDKELDEMFEGIPHDRFFIHDWKKDVVKIGEVPKDFVYEVSEGLVNEKIDVEVNKRFLDKSYDLIISIGQVVPHEVVGMANYSKNIFVGIGGNSMINKSHMLGAFYGMERMMGRDYSPVRKVFDYAQEKFISSFPLFYIFTVTTQNGASADIHGLYAGNGRDAFEEALKDSQQKNFTFLDEEPEKIVVYLDEREFKTTWLGNKAIYRTRMAIAKGGDLIILAPEVKRFGEDAENDRLIRKYGYIGRENILKKADENDDLKSNLSVAAHIIHGSSDGKFNITYAVRHMTKEEIENANFNYMDYDEAVKKYDPKKLKDGYNDVDGEKIYFISNPALGLWSSRKKFMNQ